MKLVKLLPFLIRLLGMSISLRLVVWLFGVQHWAGANILKTYGTVATIVLLILVVILSSFSNASDIVNRPYMAMPKLGRKIFGFIMAAAIIGLLFKIQHWKGADIMLIIGVGSLAIYIAINGIYLSEKVRKSENEPKP